jgi:hypothetical protein
MCDPDGSNETRQTIFYNHLIPLVLRRIIFPLASAGHRPALFNCHFCISTVHGTALARGLTEENN